MVPTDGRLTKIDIDDALQGLSEEQAAAVRQRYAEGMVDLAIRAAEVDVDGRALREKLGRAVQVATAAHEEGLSVTETTTHDHGTGRTELIVGNTKNAERGKLSSAQRGAEDHTLMYVIIVALVIIALALLR